MQDKQRYSSSASAHRLDPEQDEKMEEVQSSSSDIEEIQDSDVLLPERVPEEPESLIRRMKEESR